MKQNQKGFSLLEVVLVIALIGILLTAMLPYFSTLNTSWLLFESESEVMQNSRVAIEYFEREFTQAYKINSITDSTNNLGSITFEKSDGTLVTLLTDNTGSEMVFSLEDSGTRHEIAGPISELKFVGYDANGATTNIPALIKSVELSFLLDQSVVSTNRYTKLVTLPKNIFSSLYYSVFANDYIRLKGSGTITGDLHTNSTLSEPGSIVVTGAKTNYTKTTAIEFPTVSINMLLNEYQDLSVYEAIADHVLTGNQTFTSGNVYEGIYYIGSGGTLSIEDGVVVSGSIIAEGGISFQGDNISIVPSGNMPAVVSGHNVTFYFSNNTMNVEGTVYAADTIFLLSDYVNIVGNGKYNIALVAGNDISTLAKNLTVVGSVVAGEDIAFSNFDNIQVTATSTLPACVAGGYISTGVLSDNFIVSGILYAYGNITFNNSDVILNGSIITNGYLRVGGNLSNPNVQITYNKNNLKNPPIYMW